MFSTHEEGACGWQKGFLREIVAKYQTYVGAGHWFEMPDTYFRLGFGWPTRDELISGMEAVSKAMRDESI